MWSTVGKLFTFVALALLRVPGSSTKSLPIKSTMTLFELGYDIDLSFLLSFKYLGRNYSLELLFEKLTLCL